MNDCLDGTFCVVKKWGPGKPVVVSRGWVDGMGEVVDAKRPPARVGGLRKWGAGRGGIRGGISGRGRSLDRFFDGESVVLEENVWEGFERSARASSPASSASLARFPVSTVREDPSAGRSQVVESSSLGTPEVINSHDTLSFISSTLPHGANLPSGLWTYLLRYMPSDTPVPESPLVHELLSLPRRREIPYRWKVQLAGGHPDVGLICALLVYLSGDKADTACRLCGSTERIASGPSYPGTSTKQVMKDFGECVLLYEAASTQLREFWDGYGGGCCNVFYGWWVDTRSIFNQIGSHGDWNEEDTGQEAGDV